MGSQRRKSRGVIGSGSEELLLLDCLELPREDWTGQERGAVWSAGVRAGVPRAPGDVRGGGRDAALVAPHSARLDSARLEGLGRPGRLERRLLPDPQGPSGAPFPPPPPAQLCAAISPYRHIRRAILSLPLDARCSSHYCCCSSTVYICLSCFCFCFCSRISLMSTSDTQSSVEQS